MSKQASMTELIIVLTFVRVVANVVLEPSSETKKGYCKRMISTPLEEQDDLPVTVFS